MSIEKRMELLWEGAKSLQSESQTHKLLKSYYINTCRKLAKNSVQIPKEKFAISQMCQHCGSFWSESEYGLKLIPKQFKINSKANKLIQNFEKNDGTTRKVLNKKQRNRAKWLKKKMFSHLAIRCFQCKHSSLIKVGNPKYESRTKKEKETPTIVSKNVSVNRRNSEDGFSTKEGQEKVLISASSKSKKQAKLKEKSTKTSILKNRTKSNNISNKIISKTQKQNSLLQLAALLKKQSNIDRKSSAQKKLQSFLK